MKKTFPLILHSLKGKIRNMPVVPVLDRLLTQLCVQFLHLCALHTAKICTVKIICEICAAWNLWCAACSVTHCVNLQKTSAVFVYEGSGRAGSGASVSDLLFVLLSRHFQRNGANLVRQRSPKLQSTWKRSLCSLTHSDSVRVGVTCILYSRCDLTTPTFQFRNINNTYWDSVKAVRMHFIH